MLMWITLVFLLKSCACVHSFSDMWGEVVLRFDLLLVSDAYVSVAGL